MKIFQLNDNAIFTANCRERMRPAMVLSSIIVAAIIVVLITMNAYLAPRQKDKTCPSGRTGCQDSVPAPQNVFWYLAIGQGMLLLLGGTLTACNAACRERTSGTLDFHRSSPTPRSHQVLGLLLGAPSLEWCVFLGTLPVALIFSVLGKIPIDAVLSFYFIVSGINMGKETG